LICICFCLVEHIEGFAHHLEGFVGGPVFTGDLGELDVLGHHVHDALHGPFSDLHQFFRGTSGFTSHDLKLKLTAFRLLFQFFDPCFNQWLVSHGRCIRR